MHDLLLSKPEVREHVYAELARWMDAYSFPAGSFPDDSFTAGRDNPADQDKPFEPHSTVRPPANDTIS